VHIYDLSGTNLTEKATLEHLGSITDCSFSPDGQYLVACDVHRKVILYKTEDYKVTGLQAHFMLLFVQTNKLLGFNIKYAFLGVSGSE
jgi:WD40 repeat protein